MLPGNLRTFLLAIPLWLIAAISAQATPAITCHCFTDRAYDAANPAAADPYLLATAQNTFFANVFNVEKKSLVMMKQQGIPGEELWVAYWIASRSASDPDSLLGKRTSGQSWQDILKPLQLPPAKYGVRFAHGLAANLATNRLAATVVDELLTGYRLLEENQLEALRKAGASNQELILTTVLASRTGRPAQQIIVDSKSGTTTWGAMLANAGVDGKTLAQAVAAALERPAAVTNQTSRRRP